MKYIETLREGEQIKEIYLCKQRTAAVTQKGKPYENVHLQDKTGTLDGKIWDPNSPGIDDFDAPDYVEVTGDVTVFNGALQLKITCIRKAIEGSYFPEDYVPVSSRDIEEMFAELKGYMDSVKSPYLRAVLTYFFADETFVARFKKQSAAKSVHHGFMGGLLEHTLGVTKNCAFFADTYPLLHRDLLLTAAICHDIGKTKELSLFPENDYTDDGQLLGHIMIGAQMIAEAIAQIPNFPHKLSNELIHCILAHHGEYEFGSPKKPALAEAVALNFADNIDAKMETMKELFAGVPEGNTKWLGYNRLLESNIRRTGDYEEK